MEPVRSTRNPRVTAAARLRRARERKRLGLTLLEGPHLLEEALAAGAEVLEVFGLGSPQPAVPNWVEVTEDVLIRLADTESPRGPVAVMRIPPAVTATRDHLVLGVSDPGNAGTLIRTAAAFGLDVAFGSDAVDPWSPKVLRAAAGSHFRTVIGDRVRDAATIATVVKGGVAARELGTVLDPARRWAILVGSEAHGLSDDEVAAADVQVTIPMPGGTESLNAAVAGAIVAYELALWRNAAGGVISNR
ncbi:MAG: RNA methyltransferase [Acidimicrobiia bacterium]